MGILGYFDSSTSLAWSSTMLTGSRKWPRKLGGWIYSGRLFFVADGQRFYLVSLMPTIAVSLTLEFLNIR